MTCIMTTTAPQPKVAFLNGRQACQLAGINTYQLLQLALTGAVRTWIEPGQPVRFHQADLVGATRVDRQG